MQNSPSNFHIFSFQFSNFQFCQFSPLTFNFCQFKALLQICQCCRYTHQNDAVLHVVFKKKIFLKNLELKENKKNYNTSLIAPPFSYLLPESISAMLSLSLFPTLSRQTLNFLSFLFSFIFSLTKHNKQNLKF